MVRPNASRLWKRTRNRGTLEQVGKFFQDLTACVLRARVQASGTEDLSIGKIAVGIEVKGGDNNHPLRVPIAQLEGHQAQVGTFPAPYEYFLYCLGCYKNRSSRRDKKPRRSRLAQCRDERRLYRALAHNTHALYIFDHRLIVRLKKLFGGRHSHVTRDSDFAVIELSRRFLAGFREDNAKTALSSLGFDPTEWSIREREVHVAVTGVDLFDYTMQLQITEVLPRTLMDLLNITARVPANPERPARRTLRF